jgi:glyoxylase I family protein
MTTAGFHHVALTVSDLAASAQWYREVLGLEEAFAESSAERRAVILRLPGGSASLGLVQHGAPHDQRFDPARVGLDHLAFQVDERGELDAWARRLDERGVQHSGAIDIPPGAILNFKDPDGVALAFFWDRPG